MVSFKTSVFATLIAASSSGMLAAASPAPAVTPIISQSSSFNDGGSSVYPLPSVITGSNPVIIPSGISEGPGPVITGSLTTTGSGGLSSSVISTASNATSQTTSGTATTTGPASATSSTGAAIPLTGPSLNLLAGGLFLLSVASVDLF